MGLINKLDKWEKKLDGKIQKEKEKKKTEPSFKEQWKDEMNKVEEKEKSKREVQEQRSEQEKLAKTGNTLIKGLSFWFLIPFLAILVILLVFVGAGILDWLGII